MACCGTGTSGMFWLLAGAAAPIVAAAVALAPAAQPEKKEGAGAAAAAAAAQPEADAEMQAWIAAATPGEPHGQLEQFVGTWDAKATFWMVPDAPPQESTGVMVNSLVLGGRWLRQDYTSEMMGEPFQGLGYWGYDNVEKRFVATWMDTMSTGMMLMHGGPFDAATRTFTATGEFKDPMGRLVKQKHVTTVVSADKHVFAGYDVTNAAEERKVMEIIYTRAAKAEPVRTGQ